ncbi:MAG TPA: AI-2E family transporter [Candidatus Parcubacteria bacterium]|nr:AI-2E family transporter [Candidatus Parcubacteria bacterium]
MDKEKILDISWNSLVKISIIVIIFYLIYSIRDILIWFVFALTISVLFNPVVDFLQKRKVPRLLGATFIYFLALGVFTLLIYLMVPLFNSEIHQFLNSFPQYFQKISPPLKGLGIEAFNDINSFMEGVGDVLTKMAENIFNILFIIFGGVFSFLFIISTAFFISVEEKAIEKSLRLIFPKKHEDYVLNIWKRCEREIAGWFGARILACLFVGVLSYVALLIFGVKYPALLALFAGVLNFIPYIGPLITGLLFFVIIFPTDPIKAIFIILTFIVIQQIENNIVSPVLMKRIIGIPSVVVLISLIVGGQLWGTLGTLLAIPLFGILFEFFKEFLQRKREKETVGL